MVESKDLIMALVDLGISTADIRKEMDAEIQALSGIIDDESALMLVAKKHGVNLEKGIVPIEEPQEPDAWEGFNKELQSKFAVDITGIFAEFSPHVWTTFDQEKNAEIDLPHKCIFHVLEKRKYHNKLSDKDDFLYKVESVFPGNEKIFTEIIFGFASFHTQYTKLGIVPGDIVFMNYSGKVASPTHPGWKFKSCYLKKIGNVPLVATEFNAPTPKTAIADTQIKEPVDVKEPVLPTQTQLGKLDAKKVKK